MEEVKEETPRLKERYRALARKLHPDLNPGLDQRMVALWYQVQEAYEARDLSRLDTLYALSEMYEKNWEKIDGISILRSLFNELKGALKLLEKKLRVVRKDRSWRFNEKMDDDQKLTALHRELKRGLEFDRMRMIEEKRELESLIDSWTNPSRKKRSRKARDEFQIVTDLQF